MNTQKSRNKKQPGANFGDYLTKFPVVYIIFFVLAFLIYGQVLGFFLGKFDEDLLILGNLNILKDLGNIKLAFTRDAFLSDKGVEFYRPLQTVTYMFDTRFFFTRGSVYYFTNLLLHASTCSALFYLLNLLGKDRKAAFFFTLLFLASPLFVHAIAWAPSRGDLLIGLFGILSLIFFIRMFTGHAYKNAAFMLLAFTAAMYSKETAILIPVLLLVYYLLFVSNRKPTLIPTLVAFTGFIVVIALYFYMRSQVVRLASPAEEFGLGPLLHNLRTIPEYLAKFLVPVFLSPMSGFTLFNSITGLILIAALAGAVVKFAAKPYTGVLYGIIWFLAFALPGMMYSHKLGSAAYDYLEHRAYLPMAGIMMVMMFTFQGMTDNRIKKMVMGYIVLVAGVLGIVAFIYTRNYENPMVFYNHTIISNPASAMALSNRGLIKADLKDFQGAIADYDKAIAVKPDYAKAFVNKGIAMSSMNDKTGAIKQYNDAIRIEPDLFQAHFNKANAQFELGLFDEALNEYDKAIELYPTYVAGYNARGSIFFQRKEYDRAIGEFSHAIELDAKNTEAWLNRGKARFNNNEKDGACNDWRTAMNLGSPDATDLISQYCK